jgi:hypothetical protein
VAKLGALLARRHSSNRKELVTSTTRSLAVAASLLVVLVLSGVAAGATQKASPKKWVSTFCGSVLTWEHAVKSDSAKLTKAVSSLSKAGRVELHVARSKLVGFLGGIVKSTSTMIGKIKAVGPPAVKNSSRIQKGVLTAFAQVGQAFRDGQNQARKLPTNSAKAFSKAAYALAHTIQSSTNRIGAAFTALAKYTSKPLDDAAKKDPTCAKLNG